MKKEREARETCPPRRGAASLSPSPCWLLSLLLFGTNCAVCARSLLISFLSPSFCCQLLMRTLLVMILILCVAVDC